MDICGQDLRTPEDLQEHSSGVGDTSVDTLETPDLLGDTPEESAAVEVPKATH